MILVACATLVLRLMFQLYDFLFVDSQDDEIACLDLLRFNIASYYQPKHDIFKESTITRYLPTKLIHLQGFTVLDLSYFKTIRVSSQIVFKSNIKKSIKLSSCKMCNLLILINILSDCEIVEPKNSKSISLVQTRFYIMPTVIAVNILVISRMRLDLGFLVFAF